MLKSLRSIDPVAVLGAVILAVLLALCVRSAQAPAQAPDPRQIERARIDRSFAWVITGDEEDDSSQVLQIRFRDGRRYGIKVAAITSYTFLPEAISQRLGHEYATLEITAGATKLRLDVLDEEAIELVKLVAETAPFQSELPIESSSLKSGAPKNEPDTVVPSKPQDPK